MVSMARGYWTLPRVIWVSGGVGPDNVFLVSVQGISNTRVISDFHSKSPDLVIIIIDLSEVTVPDE